MGEDRTMILKFSDKLKQLHVSTVNGKSKHESLNIEALLAYKKITPLLDSQIPIILESPVNADEIMNEILLASLLFDTLALEQLFEEAGLEIDELEFSQSIHQNQMI